MFRIITYRFYGCTATFTNQNQFNQQIGLVLHTTDTLPTSSTHHKNHNHKQQLNNFLKKPHQYMSSMHEFHWLIATTWMTVYGCHLLANETSSYITGRLGLLTAVLVKVSIDHSYRTSYWRACWNQTNSHSKRASITALSIWSRLC